MMSQWVERTWIRTGGYGRFRGEWVNTGYPVSEMATFKFRARDLLIYSHLGTNESKFYSRSLENGLEFMSHIIHVLKSVVNNRE